MQWAYVSLYANNKSVLQVKQLEVKEYIVETAYMQKKPRTDTTFGYNSSQ